jgi:uncharacterized membrane protein required for colicin V production
MNILDISVLVLVGVFAAAGFHQGLIRTVYRLVSFFIAIILAYILYSPVADFLRSTFIFDSVQSSIKAGLDLGGFVADQNIQSPIAILETFPMPEALRGILINSANFHGAVLQETIEAHIATFFANIVINILAVVVVFFLVMILLSAIGFALDIVGKLPIINTFNNIGGLIFGAIQGAVIAWVAILLLSMFFAASPNSEIYYLIENSLVVSRITDVILPRLAEII